MLTKKLLKSLSWTNFLAHFRNMVLGVSWANVDSFVIFYVKWQSVLKTYDMLLYWLSRGELLHENMLIKLL